MRTIARICAGLGLAACLVTGGVASTERDMSLCRDAAYSAANRHAIPVAVLEAITLVETRTRRGDSSGPWPWTVNVAGKGAWFDTRKQALRHAKAALKRGVRSFDVGCFQLNYRWHGAHFGSIDEMFDPDMSSDYAARFLKTLHAESGDWMVAAGHYHSRTHHHAERYRSMVARAMTRSAPERPPRAVASAPAMRMAGRLWPLETGRSRKTSQPGATPGAVALLALRRNAVGLLRKPSGTRLIGKDD